MIINDPIPLAPRAVQSAKTHRVHLAADLEIECKHMQTSSDLQSDIYIYIYVYTHTHYV